MFQVQATHGPLPTKLFYICSTRECGDTNKSVTEPVNKTKQKQPKRDLQISYKDNIMFFL